jgi:hypothetical protein
MEFVSLSVTLYHEMNLVSFENGDLSESSGLGCNTAGLRCDGRKGDADLLYATEHPLGLDSHLFKKCSVKLSEASSLPSPEPFTVPSHKQSEPNQHFTLLLSEIHFNVFASSKGSVPLRHSRKNSVYVFYFMRCVYPHTPLLFL